MSRVVSVCLALTLGQAASSLDAWDPPARRVHSPYRWHESARLACERKSESERQAAIAVRPGQLTASHEGGGVRCASRIHCTMWRRSRSCAPRVAQARAPASNVGWWASRLSGRSRSFRSPGTPPVRRVRCARGARLSGPRGRRRRGSAAGRDSGEDLVYGVQGSSQRGRGADCAGDGDGQCKRDNGGKAAHRCALL